MATPDHRPATQSKCCPQAPRGRPARCPPTGPRACDQRAHRYAWGLALGLKGDVGWVAQAGMPALSHNLRPQVTTAQPLFTEHMHRHRGRYGRGQ